MTITRDEDVGNLQKLLAEKERVFQAPKLKLMNSDGYFIENTAGDISSLTFIPTSLDMPKLKFYISIATLDMSIDVEGQVAEHLLKVLIDRSNLLLQRVIQILESLRSKFFNGHESSGKKASWVQWKKALAPKDNGGLVEPLRWRFSGGIRKGLKFTKEFGSKNDMRNMRKQNKYVIISKLTWTRLNTQALSVNYNASCAHGQVLAL
ncbi:hypothetical protein Tco_0468185 [Tanacetum coccineum]